MRLPRRQDAPVDRRSAKVRFGAQPGLVVVALLGRGCPQVERGVVPAELGFDRGSVAFQKSSVAPGE